MQEVTFGEVLSAWESLLCGGAGTLRETLFELRNREIVEVF